jgi:zinc D-Ala-D-Ala carboxypeptidase
MINFSEAEFKCCRECKLGFKNMNEDFVRMLDIARTHANTPFKLTSTIRCSVHNKTAGGSETSSHLTGCAADIACADSSSRYKILYGLQQAGFERIGIANNFIHADSDKHKPKELIWTY